MSATQMIENAIWDCRDLFSFGPFTLVPTARRLEKNGLPVHLGDRAFNVLVILIGHASETVSRATLLKDAWPDVFVEEGSLRFQINALRKALGDDGDSAEYVSTVQGQDYRFVAPVSRVTSVKTFSTEEPSSSWVVGLPTRRARLVGRDATVRPRIAHRQALCNNRRSRRHRKNIRRGVRRSGDECDGADGHLFYRSRHDHRSPTCRQHRRLSAWHHRPHDRSAACYCQPFESSAHTARARLL